LALRALAEAIVMYKKVRTNYQYIMMIWYDIKKKRYTNRKRGRGDL
jgi:hypothetical protein